MNCYLDLDFVLSSSANAKKWEIELQTLKNNNARLTTALQESTSNVEEWKKQLAAYKEESARMKKKVHIKHKIKYKNCTNISKSKWPTYCDFSPFTSII